MTPKTLTKERTEKVFAILESAYQDNPPTQEASNYNMEQAEKIVEAVRSRSEVEGEYKTERKQITCSKCNYLTFPPICTKCGTLTTKPDFVDAIVQFELKPKSIRD